MAKTRSETVGHTAPRPAEPRSVAAEAEQPPPRWRWARLLPELVAIGLCAVLWSSTSAWSSSVGGPGPAFYPRVLIALLVLGLVVRLIQDVRAIRAEGHSGGSGATASAVDEGDADFDPSLISMKRVLIAVVLSVGYVWASLWIGWIFATFAVIVLFLVLAGRRNPLVVLPVAVVLSLGIAYVFVKVVYVSLPTGYGVFDTATFRLLELMGAV